MAGRLIPPELLVHVGICLRQARTARSLLIEQAAVQIGTTVERLKKIELGQEEITDIEAQMIIVRYGGARADRLDSLFYDWAIAEMSHQSTTERRKHLSLVDNIPKALEILKKE